MQIITTENLPIHMWLDTIEDGALVQAKNLANFPFAFHHIAIMPDAHQGYGMPIGGVMATDGVIIPYAVGKDKGCGMLACRTSLTSMTPERRKEIMSLIRKWIPIGVGSSHSTKQGDEWIPIDPTTFDSVKHLYPVVSKEYGNVQHQVGTLGAGNHFIEIQEGSDGFIWVMIHSGSRNLGSKCCDYYNDVAKTLTSKAGYNSLVKQELAYLAEGTKEYDNYMTELKFCLDFARNNRLLMFENIKRAFNTVPCPTCKGKGGHNGLKCLQCAGIGLIGPSSIQAVFDEPIEIHHNYAAKELHFGKVVMVHRKGATFAGSGNIGIIPGSQSTKSYIVRGLGNPDSFLSCSHGSGRAMTRGAAKKNLDLQTEIDKMDKLGIVHGMRTIKDLEEAGATYKDIQDVMNQQKDLVEILVELKPLASLKG